MNSTPAPRLLFLFDMDDVLVRYDWATRMAGLTAITGHDLDELRRRWWLSGNEQRAEAGGFADADEYLAAFQQAMGCTVPESEWARVRGTAMTELPERIEAVRIASEHGRVALLTNNGPLAGRWIPTWAPSLPPLFGEHLDTTSNFGARKPDPQVFERAMAHHGATAQDTFFADDMPENVEGARSVGIHAVLVEHDTDLREAVRDFVASKQDSRGPRRRFPADAPAADGPCRWGEARLSSI